MLDENEGSLCPQGAGGTGQISGDKGISQQLIPIDKRCGVYGGLSFLHPPGAASYR